MSLGTLTARDGIVRWVFSDGGYASHRVVSPASQHATVNVVLQPDAEGSDTADVGSLSLHEHHEWDHRSCVKLPSF